MGYYCTLSSQFERYWNFGLMASKEETFEAIKSYALIIILLWLITNLTFWKLVPEGYWVAKRVTLSHDTDWTDYIVPKWSTVIKFDVAGLSSCFTPDHTGSVQYNVSNLLIEFWDHRHADQDAILRMLHVYVDSGCHIDTLNPADSSFTLFKAISMNEPILVKELIILGADPSLRANVLGYKHQLSALEYARRLNQKQGINNQDIIMILKESSFL